MHAFCRRCGKATHARIPQDDDRLRDVCTACGEIHYVNPKVVVGSVCQHGGMILLCRRAIEPRTGYWTIPAGYMETGETAEEGAKREAYEEARATIEIDGLLAVYSIPRLSQVQLLYRARLVAPHIEPGPESLEVAMFGWSEVPWEDLAFPTVRWILTRAREIRDQTGPLVTVGNPEPS